MEDNQNLACDLAKCQAANNEAKRQNSELEGKVKQVTETVPDSIVSRVAHLINCSDCFKLVGKVDELVDRVNNLTAKNLKLTDQLETVQIHHDRLKRDEKEFKTKLEAFQKDKDELTRTLLCKQDAIYSYIDQMEEAKKEAALAKCEAEKVNKKLESYL